MSSYFSSITSSSAISNLGTRLTSLRRAITLGDEADDPDHEDCSHISNVLRAYYTEKGRPYPAWLPADPKAPAPPPSRIVATTQIQPSAQGQTPAIVTTGGRGGLGDLWGDSGSAQPPTSQTASLRRGRAAGAPLSATHSAPVMPSTKQQMSSSSGPSPMLHPDGPRPLPSQRAGSMQSAPQPPSLNRATSAQERLRQRLHGGRSPSPSQSQSPGSSRAGSPFYGGDPAARKPVGSRMR
ncbi:hypothetical protein ASPWEDRAFT_322074 [Aspergillus wentii DTO 134E9]|uniref:Mso1 N-terminal domain-containing protein n=1 Tax=Aspergillus wentii DTO 134E9 TaxID=1073089 RepID=A0A1L9RU27_ASPWE|nr:uncharacterized protein ASPWEDRAFT_322074 [Aspergillus wentii DTO 134E9]KAI9934037.1 hypothetical protein MW887_005110 [Aspergillus wentii]OJJ38404.1 hypothetical protein ASPWEDRAFT_322074 [Aspergillus wentii DTO 134E9]